MPAMQTTVAILLLICSFAARLSVAGRVDATKAAAGLKDLQRHGSAGHDNGALPAPRTVEQRETRFPSTLDGMYFLKDMLKFANADYNELFCSRAEAGEDGVPCATVKGFPGSFSDSELRFNEITEQLMTVPEREVSGEIVRLGDLGYFIFNDLLWSNDWKTFPIGGDIEDHRKGRVIADILMGANSPAWNRETIRASVAQFFEGRATLSTNDLGLWINKLLHKILLDMDITDIESQDFELYKGASLTASLLPRWIASGLKWALSLTKTKRQRDQWLEKYEDAIEKDTRGFYTKPEDARDRRFLADLLLTSMTSAGGLSVPTVLNICVGILYAGENSPWKGDRKLKTDNIVPFFLEAVRAFPPVVGFPWWSPDQQHRTVMNVAMSLKDPRVWEEPAEFKLRPAAEYHSKAGSGSKIGIAWAEQAKGPDGLTPDSRGCPGQEMSILIFDEFLKALMPIQDQWWVSDMPEGGITITEGPSKASTFTLTRDEKNAMTHVATTHAVGTPCTDQELEEDAMAECMAASQPQFIPAATPQFTCPTECQECCIQVISWSIILGRQEKSQFKCIMPKEAKNTFKILGRECEDASMRDSNKEQAKSACKFTDSEMTHKFYQELSSCSK